jgi:class 3 adenylate cyclase
MLFADVKGFSKLTDEQLPRFTEHVLGACAEVLARQGDDLVCRNTWGDALYVALLDPSAGARCALGLQDAMAALDLAALGLPSHHVGPVFPAVDPVLQEATVIGSHVSRTARIEPVTPPGEVYVTEPFAAALALDGDPALLCDYVGHLPAAKDFGRLRMYRLHRSGA